MRESVLLEIDLGALRHNLSEVRRAVGPSVAVAAVVKANAYGLGSISCGREFLDSGASLLAVARAEEAFELRQALPGAPLLVMGHTSDDLLPLCVDRDISATIFEESQAAILSAAAAKSGKPAAVHIKVDTGMNRLGLRCVDADRDADRCAGEIARMAALPGIRVEGIYTHLALVDGAEDALQAERFRMVVDAAGRLGVDPPIKHVCDSIGLVRYPEYRLDMVRAGAILYGMPPAQLPPGFDLDIRFSARWTARVSRVASLAAGEGVGYDFTYRAPEGGAIVATVTVGYADGYPRRMGNRAQAVVRGERAPVIGLVCMDQLNLDVSGIPGVRPGDEVELLGGGVGIMELADWAGTNRNEILSAVGRRVPRRYTRNGRAEAAADYLATEGISAWTI